MFMRDWCRQHDLGRRGLWSVVLFSVLLLTGCTPGEQPQTADKPIAQVPAHATLSPEQMAEDLGYTVTILKHVHPATYHGFSDQQKAVIDAAYRRIQKPMPAKEFYFIANSVLCSLQDGHTHLNPIQHQENHRIDVPIIWLQDGFHVGDAREPFQQGDRIVAMGGKSMEDLYRQMRVLIPAENEHYRKWCMAGQIQREEFLEYLEVVKNDTVEIGLERAGREMTLTVPLQPAAPANFPGTSRPWVGYQVDAELSLGVFHLDACYRNEQYTKTVQTFFQEVSDKHIRNIAVDVRRNGGGNSQVIDEFFRYLNIDQYRHYSGDVRYSKEVAQKNGYHRTSGYERGKPHKARNHKVQEAHLLFDGELFVLTSPQTFSSGNWFAVMVKDNGLGTIIGEPTGNAPSSYGDVPTFQMPHTGFSFTVSHKRWVRPNPDNDPADALYPDIPVYTTIDDIIKGIDPQLEKLKTIIRQRSRR